MQTIVYRGVSQFAELRAKPALSRAAAPDDPLEALERFPGGLVTQEVAAIMAHNNQPVDCETAERALVELVGAGRAIRTQLADDALWQAA